MAAHRMRHGHLQPFRRESTDPSNGHRHLHAYLPGRRVEFLDGTAETLNHPESRIVLEGLHHQYKLTDHLGNTVVLFEDKNQDGQLTTEQDTQDSTDLEVLQRMYYYPFGMPMEGSWNDLSNPKMRYLYNGKEEIADLELNYLDYGARWYMYEVGRWSGVDPLADQYPAWSPYNYVLVYRPPKHPDRITD